MNATNPFQIPSCFQVDYERRRCERFKRTFMGVVAAGTLLMVALLIEGSMSERAKAASATSLPASLPEPQPSLTAVSTEVKPVSVPQPNPSPALSQSATAVSKVNTAPAVSVAAIYTVKTGDSLTRIARTHGTTVKAVKAANGLTDDHIAAGMKLKLPQA